MTVTLVNLFTVEPDQEEGFVARFRASAEALAGIPGFLRTDLHINSGVGDQTYRFVNIAHWESAEAWREALPKIIASVASQGGAGMGSAMPKAAIYESVFKFPAERSEAA